jgi:hypothetical protein
MLPLIWLVDYLSTELIVHVHSECTILSGLIVHKDSALSNTTFIYLVFHPVSPPSPIYLRGLP